MWVLNRFVGRSILIFTIHAIIMLLFFMSENENFVHRWLPLEGKAAEAFGLFVYFVLGFPGAQLLTAYIESQRTEVSSTIFYSSLILTSVGWGAVFGGLWTLIAPIGKGEQKNAADGGPPQI